MQSPTAQIKSNTVYGTGWLQGRRTCAYALRQIVLDIEKCLHVFLGFVLFALSCLVAVLTGAVGAVVVLGILLRSGTSHEFARRLGRATSRALGFD